MDQSFQLDFPHYFIRNGFEIKVRKTDTSIEIEAEELKTCKILSRKLTQADLPKLDPGQFYPTLNDLFSSLLHGFIGELNLFASIGSDAKISLKTKTKIGNAEKDYIITISLEEENLEAPDVCLRLMERLEEQQTQSLEQKQANYVKIMRQVILHQKEQDRKSVEAPGQSTQIIHNRNNNELKTELSRLDSVMNEFITKQGKNIEEVNLGMKRIESEFEKMNKRCELLENEMNVSKEKELDVVKKLYSELEQMNQRLGQLENKNKIFEESFSSTNTQVNNIEASMQAVLDKISESQVQSENNSLMESINKTIDSMKGQIKLLSEIISKNASKKNDQIENALKSLKDLDENYQRLKKAQTDSEEKIKLFEAEASKLSQLKMELEKSKAEKPQGKDHPKIDELSKEIVKMNEKIETLKTADRQIDLVLETLREQIKKEDLNERLKTLEKGYKELFHNGLFDPLTGFEKLSPQFDQVVEDALVNLKNNNKSIETKAGAFLERSLFAKDPLPKKGKFHFSISLKNVSIGQIGAFAVGIAGLSLKETQALVLPGCYFIDPFHKLAYLNGNQIAYVGDSVKPGDALSISCVVDYDNAIIYFKINEVNVFEGAIVLEDLDEKMYPCIYAHDCSDISLSFL